MLLSSFLFVLLFYSISYGSIASTSTRWYISLTVHICQWTTHCGRIQPISGEGREGISTATSCFCSWGERIPSTLWQLTSAAETICGKEPWMQGELLHYAPTRAWSHDSSVSWPYAHSNQRCYHVGFYFGTATQCGEDSKWGGTIWATVGHASRCGIIIHIALDSQCCPQLCSMPNI